MCRPLHWLITRVGLNLIVEKWRGRPRKNHENHQGVRPIVLWSPVVVGCDRAMTKPKRTHIENLLAESNPTKPDTNLSRVHSMSATLVH